MLWTVVGLFVLWGLGLPTSHAMGGLIQNQLQQES
jgi:hypothetical protein